MEFSKRKLPFEAASSLRMCPIVAVKPFTLMLTPVYVFLKRNGKFVSVKAPLDFFTPEDLEQLLPYESFFITESIDQAAPFFEAARRVRNIINWQPRQVEGTKVSLPPAPYEVSDAVLRVIGPLWGAGDAENAPAIEPFFVTAFVNELCEAIPLDLMLEARNQDIALYERALFCSSWAVFLALHLGHCDLPFLNRLRHRVFEGVTKSDLTLRIGSEIDDLISLAVSTVESHETRVLNSGLFASSSKRVSHKITSRLERVRTQFVTSAAMPSVFGPRGFRDV